MRDIMFASVWTALMPLCLRASHVGVLVWVWVALLQPNDLLMGFMAGVPFNKVVAVITLATMVFSLEKKQPYFDLNLGLLVLFAAVATISWVGGLVPMEQASDLYEKIIKVLVLAFVLSAVMYTRHRMHLLVLVIVLGLGFLAVKEGLIEILSAGGHKIIGNASVGDNNSLATALLMIIPLAVYCARYSAVFAVKLGLWIIVGLAVVTVVMTFSRGGFLGLLILGLFTVKNSRRKLPAVILVLLAGCFILLFAPSNWYDRLDTIETADNDASFMGRVVAWKISLLIALNNPLFGGGLHAVQYPAVWSAFRPLLYQVDFVTTPAADEIAHAAHSIYFEVLGDMGFVGLGVFLAILARTLMTCRFIRKQSAGDASLEWAGDLSRMIEISVVIYATTGAALSMAYFELFYILVALASRCHQTVRSGLTAKRAQGECR